MSAPEDERPAEEEAVTEAGADKSVPAQSVDPDEDTESEQASDTDEETPANPEQVIADLKDRLLRTMADMENLRNRARREQEDALKYANANFARDLLNVSDNLRRALESVPDDPEPGSQALTTLKEGIEMTERELLSVFERFGVSEIDPKGEKFDHNVHQAMCKVPGSGAEPGTIVQVMQVGYTLQDRLLRPAMVGVAANDDDGGEPDPGPEGIDTTA
jgi:molecular chaperone GrpE